MQAIALVTGDEFLAPFNLTIDTDDVLDYMLKLLSRPKQIGYLRDYHFDDSFGIDFAVIVGSSGFCFSFNVVNAEELFNLEKYSLLFV
jgi:hypothetical protein